MADISRIHARYLAQNDQMLQEFRSWFANASHEERQALAQWLSDAAELETRLPNSQAFSLLCSVNNQSIDETGKITYDGVVYLGPKVMRNAIAKWLVNEEYVPTNFMELF